jgi:hypothetical protein
MLWAIEGIYRDAKVELTETPEGIAEGRVVVTFLSVVPVAETNQMISFGIFAGDPCGICGAARQSTEADFRDAEYCDEADSQFIIPIQE